MRQLQPARAPALPRRLRLPLATSGPISEPAASRPRGSLTCGIEADSSSRGIQKFSSAGELKDVLLAAFKNIGSVTLSTPPSQSISPQKGLRGRWRWVRCASLQTEPAGDRFHPFLTLIEPDCVFDRLIHTHQPCRVGSPVHFAPWCMRAVHVHHREVQLAQHDGTHDAMKDCVII